MHSASHTVQRAVNCFLGGFDNISSEHNWMSFIYMFANKFPVTLHLGMCTLGCLFMTEEPDIWPVASIWPQSCCKVLLPVFSPSAPSLWIGSVRSRAPHQWTNRSAAFWLPAHGPHSSDMASSWWKQENATCYLNERKDKTRRKRNVTVQPAKGERSRKEEIKDLAARNSGSVNFNTHSAIKGSYHSGQISSTPLALVSFSVKQELNYFMNIYFHQEIF